MASVAECPEVIWLEPVGQASGNGGGGFEFRGSSGNCVLETAPPRGGSTLHERRECADVEGPVDMRVWYGSDALSRGGTDMFDVGEGRWYLCVQPAHNNKTWKDKGICCDAGCP